MNGLRRLMAIAVLLASAMPSDADAAVSLSPENIFPGSTVRLEIRDSTNRRLHTTLKDKRHDGYEIGGGTQRILVGIPLDAELGKATLELKSSDGTVIENVLITIQPKKFGEDKIDFTKDKTKLLESDLDRKESAQIHKAMRRRSSRQRWQGKFVPPVDGPVVGGYGDRRTLNGVKDAGVHKGMDLKATEGTPLMAAASGIVVMTHPFKLHGNTVIVDHGQGVMSLYLHLKSFSVKRGATVRKGQILGLVGSTGLSTAPHVHWGVYVNNVPVDPKEWTEREY